MKNIKISLKLLLLTSISSVIMVVIGIYGLKSLTVVNNGMETMYHDRVVPLKQLKLVSDAYAVNVVDAVNKANSDIISWKKALRELDKAQLIISENWTSYLKTKIEGDERRLVEEAQKIMDNSSSEAISHAYDLFSEGKDSLSIIELNRFVRENLYRDIEPLTDKVTQLIDLQLEISDQIQQEGMTTYNSTVYSLWAILIIGILAGILFSFYLVNQINGSITLANNVVHKMAKGDLSEEFISLSNDEIGVLLQNLERMRLRLQDIISNIVSSSNNIVTASKELSSTSQELSRGAGEQAVSAEEASSSIEEMESNIQQNAENSSITERIAYNASSKIEESNRASAEVIDVMLLISEKISIINDIADKTDLLAINAAVEAARADENGKGFAVIAAEVRSLAERSANASKEIEEVSKKGVLAAQKAGKLLTEVVPEIQKTSSLIQEISVSSAEQSSGTKQISTAIQQLNQVTQQNAAVAEEMATSSEELSSQAELMKDIMSFFNVSQKYVTRKVNRKENLNITTKQPAKVIEKDGIDLDLGPEQSDDDYQKF